MVFSILKEKMNFMGNSEKAGLIDNLIESTQLVVEEILVIKELSL